jgi:hypothetical protein
MGIGGSEHYADCQDSAGLEDFATHGDFRSLFVSGNPERKTAAHFCWDRSS